MSTRKRTDAQMIKAIRDARGLIAVAARKLDISRQAIYNRLKVSEDVADAVEEAREFTTDVAEAKLFQAIEGGEAWAVCFYLKCQGKDRGYVERQQHELSGPRGGPIQVETNDVRERFTRRIAGIASRVGANGGDRGAAGNGASGS